MDQAIAEARAQVDKAINISLSLVHGTLQKYVAHLQGVEPEVLFPEISPTAALEFKTADGKKCVCLKLEIVETTHRAPFQKYGSPDILDAVKRIGENVPIIMGYILENEVFNKPDVVAKLTNPEILNDWSITWTPSTTAFLHNPELKNARTMHDNYKKLGFTFEEQNTLNKLE